MKLSADDYDRLAKAYRGSTPDDIFIRKLYKALTRKDDLLVGRPVMKEFVNGWYRGTVVRRDAAGLFVEYEDGDSEHLSDKEVQEILYKEERVKICDAIQWVEESGNKAQSFAMVCKRIVNGRPMVEKQIPKIFKKIMNVRLEEDTGIHPFLWSYLGYTEMEKLYNGKRVIEALSGCV